MKKSLFIISFFLLFPLLSANASYSPKLEYGISFSFNNFMEQQLTNDTLNNLSFLSCAPKAGPFIDFFPLYSKHFLLGIHTGIQSSILFVFDIPFDLILSIILSDNFSTSFQFGYMLNLLPPYYISLSDSHLLTSLFALQFNHFSIKFGVSYLFYSSIINVPNDFHPLFQIEYKSIPKIK